MERTEFLRICQSRSAQHVSIRPETSREEFLGLFQKITAIGLTDRNPRSILEQAVDLAIGLDEAQGAAVAGKLFDGEIERLVGEAGVQPAEGGAQA